ncbi:hypothetical protein JB92DRAFT_3102656 [Gautieria morchelliformis]|nr:hypothetical protein JB92DRAFT_3102656 [Gautieria morchelliformis]
MTMPRILVMFVNKQRRLATTVHKVAIDTAKLISDVSRPVVVLGGTAVDITSVKVLARSTSPRFRRTHVLPTTSYSLQTTSSLGPQSRVPHSGHSEEDTDDE